MVSMVRRLQMAGESFYSKLNTMVGILSFKVFQENNRANLILNLHSIVTEVKLTGPNNYQGTQWSNLKENKCSVSPILSKVPFLLCPSPPSL